MMEQKTIREFVDVLSTKEPVPGGGGASALAAALGMSLGSMVANLTVGKKKYAQYEEELEQILKCARTLTDELLVGMDKDAEAFEPLSRAYGMPRETEEEQSKREAVMAEALLSASMAPLELMEKIVEAMELLRRLADIGTNLAISDVGVGIQLGGAALKGASLNVFINTKLMKDKETAARFNERADSLIQKGEQLLLETYEIVTGKIR